MSLDEYVRALQELQAKGLGHMAVVDSNDREVGFPEVLEGGPGVPPAVVICEEA